jgi:hypothetical protein
MDKVNTSQDSRATQQLTSFKWLAQENNGKDGSDHRLPEHGRGYKRGWQVSQRIADRQVATGL